MKTVGIIPARFDSSRFPGKPLIDLVGKSMIQRVYEQCQKAKKLDQVIIATDDERIYEHVKTFSGQVCMTSAHHSTGTSRIAELAKSLEGAQTIVNIQGDEPLISPQQIDELIDISHKGIATQCMPIDKQEDLFDPNVVKVIFDKNGKALYFSRQCIPYGRNVEKSSWLQQHNYYRHIGMYSFDRSTLLRLENLEESKLEKMESLEQLSWLENGIPISVGITKHASISIDTPDDAEKVRKLLALSHE